MPKPFPLTGVILAGGNSTRMGRPKHHVPMPDGRAMMAHVLEALTPVCRQVAVSGPAGNFALPPGIPAIADLRPGEGPLAALEAILASGLDTRYLLVSCDQPLLTPALLCRLASQSLMPNQQGFPAFFCAINEAHKTQLLDPFPGIYPEHLLGDVQRALDAGQRSIRDCNRQWECHPVPLSREEEALLTSMNTPADLAALKL